MRHDRPIKSENFKAIARAFTTKCVSLKNSDHLHFLGGGRRGRGGGGLWGGQQFRVKNTALSKRCWYFFMFSSKNLCFYYFHFFMMKYQISAIAC